MLAACRSRALRFCKSGASNLQQAAILMRSLKVTNRVRPERHSRQCKPRFVIKILLRSGQNGAVPFLLLRPGCAPVNGVGGNSPVLCLAPLAGPRVPLGVVAPAFALGTCDHYVFSFDAIL
jgi:hypothetical protein